MRVRKAIYFSIQLSYPKLWSKSCYLRGFQAMIAYLSLNIDRYA